MRIGILTHPQGGNYGGLLQCYALCTYLKKLGHDPIVIQRVADRSFWLWEFIRNILKTLHFPRYYNSNNVDRLVHIRPFIDKYLIRTMPIDSQRKMRKVCEKYHLDAVIVGSDQVWRHDYAMKFGYNYFLDFVPENIIKLSYAASFGLSEWHYTASQTKKIKQLLSCFRGISVRESDAVPMLKHAIGINSMQLIDPTMLLLKEDYDIITSPRIVLEKYVFVYWLGDKQTIYPEIEKYRNNGFSVVDLNLRDRVEQIPVEDWLSYIKYADRVITDSFHGCVFSILFERQFKVYLNTSGGTSRIASLCSMFSIRNECQMDYSALNDILEQYRNKSENYFKSILC